MSSNDDQAGPGAEERHQRAEDLHERAVLGGAFYLFSWLLVAWQGQAWARHPQTAAAFALVFVALWVTRLLIRRDMQRHPSRAATSLKRQWGVLLVTAALWGGLSCWALVDPHYRGARTVVLLSTTALAMAFAQIFAVNRRLSLLGTALLFLPMLAVAVLQFRDGGISMVLALTLVYLVAVIGRSHREYEGKLALDRELREQRDRFAAQSRTDALTGLANRGHFQHLLSERVAAARAGRQPLGLLIADLDHFKTINDRHGHAAGDRCLREVAALLRDCFAGDAVLVARLGGEEFGVLVEGDAAGVAMRVAETFRARLARLRIELGDGIALAATVSLGLAQFQPDVHADADTLYGAADEALYRAKNGGRNRLEAA